MTKYFLLRAKHLQNIYHQFIEEISLARHDLVVLFSNGVQIWCAGSVTLEYEGKKQLLFDGGWVNTDGIYRVIGARVEDLDQTEPGESVLRLDNGVSLYLGDVGSDGDDNPVVFSGTDFSLS